MFIVPNLVCKTFILIIVKSTNATESINFSNLLLKKKTCRTLAMKFRKKNLNLYRLSFRFHIVQICKTYAKHTLTIFFRTLLNSGWWIKDYLKKIVFTDTMLQNIKPDEDWSQTFQPVRIQRYWVLQQNSIFPSCICVLGTLLFC